MMISRFLVPTLAFLLALIFTSHVCYSFSPPLYPKEVPRRLGTKRTTTQSLQSTNLQAITDKQLIEFKEPTTGVTVKLVGCMHYNPASIQLTTKTIQELAEQDRLGAVIIESCDIRWEKTVALPENIQKLLQSEMKAACELAMDVYQRPVVLGDQRINITVDTLGQGLKETFVDLVTPWNGGWNRLVSNVTAAKDEALPTGDGYLNLFAFFDPQLLLAAPVSLIIYPLSYLFRSPLPTLAFFSLLFLTEQPTAGAATIMTMDQMTWSDWVGSLAVSSVEIALFARIFLKELLVERNKLLAKNILEQCKLYAGSEQQNAKSTSSRGGGLWDFFGVSTKDDALNKDDPFEVIYVKGAEPQGGPFVNDKSGDTDNEMAVVAVLGMAHCNGIAKLLKEQLVS